MEIQIEHMKQISCNFVFFTPDFSGNNYDNHK